MLPVLKDNITLSPFLHPALHIAVMHGRLNNVRTLLTESTVDAEAFNLRCLSSFSLSLLCGGASSEKTGRVPRLLVSCQVLQSVIP